MVVVVVVVVVLLNNNINNNINSGRSKVGKASGQGGQTTKESRSLSPLCNHQRRTQFIRVFVQLDAYLP